MRQKIKLKDDVEQNEPSWTAAVINNFITQRQCNRKYGSESFIFRSI